MLSQARAASGTFADVPADHWAYQAVDTLQKAGIVIGYPDGTYSGGHAMTRYEFAEAVARLLPLLKTDTSSFATHDDLAAAKADLQAKLDANSAAITALQQLVNGFQGELTQLGQNVTAVQASLSSLETRVDVLEAEQKRVRITGDYNLIARATQISKGNYAIDENGGLFETAPKSLNTAEYGADGYTSNRVFQTDSVLNDFLLGIRGRLNDQATANILIDFGNYVPSLGNTVTPYYYADGNYGEGYYGSGGPGQATIWEAYLSTPTGYGPLGQGDFKAGRLPVQWTNYTLKSNYADHYTTSIYHLDSGNIPLDGASADLHTGPVNWNAWAGTFNSVGYAQPFGGATLGGYNSLGYGGVPQYNYNSQNYIQGLVTAGQQLAEGLNGFDDAEAIHQGAGLRGTLGGGTSKVGVSLAQYAFDTPIADPESETANNGGYLTANKTYNRLTVYGADYTGTIPYIQKFGIGLDASYNVAAFANGSGFNNIESGWRNSETDDQLSVKVGPVALKGGYKYIGPDYSAPGYWGNLGSWSNPTNVEGPVVSAKIKFMKTTGIDLGFADYDGVYSTTKDGLLYNTPLLHDDELTQYTAGTGFAITHRDIVHVGYEYDDYDIKANQVGNFDGEPLLSNSNSGHPNQSFLTLGLNHQINPNATFKLTYQYFTYNDNNSGFLNAPDFFSYNGSTYTNNSEGSTVVGQFSLKF
jgi:uncharacterized protein YukE